MRCQRGFTIIEVMVALGMFGVASAMMATSMVQMQRVNYENEVRSGAYAAAQLVLDDIRSQNIGVLPTSGSGPTQNITVSTRTYNVTPSYCITPSDCSSANVRGIRASVSYRGRVWYVVDTIYARLQ
jgi:prepilin-type N-terminal cleavage/methylation domain-containing protein